MATTKQTNIFFTAGRHPTKDELAQAEALGITCFRNSALVTVDSALERCDGVAGTVPARYAKLKAAPKVLTAKPAK